MCVVTGCCKLKLYNIGALGVTFCEAYDYFVTLKGAVSFCYIVRGKQVRLLTKSS